MSDEGTPGMTAFVGGFIFAIVLAFVITLANERNARDEVADHVCQQDGYTSGHWDGEQVICVTEQAREAK